MKSLLLAFLVFSVAVSQITASVLHITIFYETLCPACKKFFREQFAPTFEDETLRNLTRVELVPFGNAEFTKNQSGIICQHGPDECYGNAINACFMARHPKNNEQIAFVACTMSDSYPPDAGKDCAQKLGYSFKDVRKCAENEEGVSHQIQNGRRTLDFKPEIEYTPTIVFDNVYNDTENDDSLDDFRGVIIQKLHEKGIKF